MATHFTFCTLNELGVVARGKSKHRPRNDPGLYGGVYPFIQTGDVKHANFYITNFSQTYNEKGLAQSKLWNPGTLCITIAANIADTAILKIPACFPDSIIGFIPFSDKSNVKFIKYYLDAFKIQIESISHGTTQDNLSLEKLLSIKMRVPPLPTQKKIAAVLSTYDDLIEHNTRRIALLERMAEELYKEWFVRMRFPGYAQTRFVKGIPEGWEVKPSSEVLDVMSGGTPKTDVPSYWDGGIPFFTPKDAGDAFYTIQTEKTITEAGLSKCNSKLYPKNTIFITARGTVGKIALAAKDMAMNQSCYALKPSNARCSLFYFLALNQSISIIKGASKSGVFDNIIVDTFKTIPLVIPESNIMQKFESVISSIFEQLLLLQDKNQLLRQTRDRLLTRLISGKLSVEDLDIAFPPSMLEEA